MVEKIPYILAIPGSDAPGSVRGSFHSEMKELVGGVPSRLYKSVMIRARGVYAYTRIGTVDTNRKLGTFAVTGERLASLKHVLDQHKYRLRGKSRFLQVMLSCNNQKFKKSFFS